MLRAIARAAAQMFSGPILGLVGGCALLSAACFVALWFAIDWLLQTWLSDTWLAGVVVDVLGGVATLVLAWLLFPAVAGAFVGLFLERVATLVERRHYPQLPPAPGLPLWPALAVSLRFLAVLILANALLCVLLLVPPVFAVAWFVVNGWLLGREYFELVALRRLQPPAARALRRRHGLECLLTGTALAAALTLPVVNLVLPIFATAVMVHRYHDWWRAENGSPDYSSGG